MQGGNSRTNEQMNVHLIVDMHHMNFVESESGRLKFVMQGVSVFVNEKVSVCGDISAIAADSMAL